MSRTFIVAACVPLLVGCSNSQRIQVASSDIPYSKQFTMQSGDALVFQLPDGKSVAVWCEKPKFGVMAAEQTTMSGLKTAWGERPFKRPEPLRQQVGPDTYVSAGWQSYIEQGSVTTIGDSTSEYELFVGDLRISIVEDLKATGSLPVTINFTKR